MSIYSTLSITREDAIVLIMKNLSSLTDNELADACQTVWGEKHLHNFSIVTSYESDDWPYKWSEYERWD